MTNKTLRFSLSMTFTAVALAGACSGGDEKEGIDESTPAAGTSSSGATGPVVGVDPSGGAQFEPPPSSGGAGSDPDPTPGPDPLECPSIMELGDCGTTSVQAELQPVNVLLVIDKSGSMEDTPPGFDVSKWEALEAALGEALNATSVGVNYGLVLFPDAQVDTIDCGADCCTVPAGASAVNVPIGTGIDSVRDVMLAIGDTGPGGGTPTAAALARALQYFTTGDGAGLSGNNYVLLATDGGPNCDESNVCEAATCTSNMDNVCMIANCCDGAGELCLDDQNVLAQIAALDEAGIPTFVIGIPGTEAYADYLDTFAIAGGVPNPSAPPEYFAVDAADTLADTFTAITSSLIRSCTVPLSEAPPLNDLVNVAVDCEVIPNPDGIGWEIPADDPETLVIKGNACTFIESEGAQRIDVVYGCPTIR
jgi:hypothetical protein